MSNDFIKGALIGGIMGSAAGLLMAPKSGHETCQDIAEGCNALNEKRCELTKSIKNTGHSLLHPFEREEDHSNQSFLIGSAIGAVISIIASLLLAPTSGNKLRSSIGDSYDDIIKKAEKFASNLNNKGSHLAEEITDWKDALTQLVNKLSQSKNKKNNFHLNEILDYATMGLQLFQQLKNRK